MLTFDEGEFAAAQTTYIFCKSGEKAMTFAVQIVNT